LPEYLKARAMQERMDFLEIFPMASICSEQRRISFGFGKMEIEFTINSTIVAIAIIFGSVYSVIADFFFQQSYL